MIEVLKQMVDALKLSAISIDNFEVEKKSQEAIQAGRQAIAELESQEPVASSLVECIMSARKEFSAIKGESQFCTECHAFERADLWWQEWHGGDIEYITGAVYTHPPQRTWVGLTDGEMEDTLIQCGGRWNGDYWEIENADFHPFLRTIEAKLKEKNNA